MQELSADYYRKIPIIISCFQYRMYGNNSNLSYERQSAHIHTQGGQMNPLSSLLHCCLRPPTVHTCMHSLSLSFPMGGLLGYQMNRTSIIQ